MTDTLEELEDWLKFARGYPADSPFAVREELIQHARDEIAALRAECTRHANERDGLAIVNKHARNEALEDAAKVCECQRLKFEEWSSFDFVRGYDAGRDRCTTAIRAMKGTA